jgi:hypothetical protein
MIYIYINKGLIVDLGSLPSKQPHAFGEVPVDIADHHYEGLRKAKALILCLQVSAEEFRRM